MRDVGGLPDNTPCEHPFAKSMCSLASAFSFELFMGHYVDCLKIVKQAGTQSYPEISRNMIKGKGLIGVLDGFVPWGAVQACMKGWSFGIGHAQAKVMFNKSGFSKSNPRVSEVMAGGIGGVAQGIMMGPLLLLKTRVVTDPSYRASGGFLQTGIMSAQIGVKVVKTEGPLALTKGLPVFTAKRGADWTTRFLFVEMCESIAKGGDEKKKLAPSVKYACAVAGGTISAFSTLPLDVIVAMQQSANSSGEKTSALQLVKNQYAAGGMSGVLSFGTKGLVARVVHVSLTTLVMKELSSVMYNAYAATQSTRVVASASGGKAASSAVAKL